MEPRGHSSSMICDGATGPTANHGRAGGRWRAFDPDVVRITPMKSHGACKEGLSIIKVAPMGWRYSPRATSGFNSLWPARECSAKYSCYPLSIPGECVALSRRPPKLVMGARLWQRRGRSLAPNRQVPLRKTTLTTCSMMRPTQRRRVLICNPISNRHADPAKME